MGLIKHIIKETLSKSAIDNIDSISEFITIINSMDSVPQRGFSYKPNSASRLKPSSILMHTSTEENIKSIIQSKQFKGVSPYYSSFTKVKNNSTKYIKDGKFAFAFDTTNKKGQNTTKK